MSDSTGNPAEPATEQAPSDEVSMKKSAYRGLVATAIVGIAVGAFFAGYLAAHTADTADYVTESQLRDLLARVQLASDSAPPKLVVSLDDDPVIGNPDAPVTLVEFSDFECPFCARFHEQTLPLIMENYVAGGAVKVVYRDFPIDRIHPNAMAVHIASECADEQGMFWQYHDMLFERQAERNGLNRDGVVTLAVQYAEALSLDTEEFTACLDDPAVRAEIEADRAQGSLYGVTGTPAFFIGNDQSGYAQVSGAKPFESFADIIGQKLGR